MSASNGNDTAAELAALKEEVRALCDEVARLRADLAPHDGTHPAYQAPWREVNRGRE